MSALGLWSTQLHGKTAKLRTDLDAHIAASALGVHGSTVVATANRLVHRDASGRAQIATPSAAADIANKGYVDGLIAGIPPGTVTQINTGTGLTGGPITGTGTISLANSGVAAGTYAFATVVVDSFGRVTSASAGSPVTSISVGPGSGLTSTGGTTPQISQVPANASQNGYMTNTYAAKLNGIEAGAQVNDVTSVFGRTGAITANAGDYTIQKISGVTVSTAGPSGGVNGDIWIQVV